MDGHFPSGADLSSLFPSPDELRHEKTEAARAKAIAAFEVLENLLEELDDEIALSDDTATLENLTARAKRIAATWSRP